VTQGDKSNWAEAVRELRGCLGKEKKRMERKDKKEGEKNHEGFHVLPLHCSLRVREFPT